jgi:hypothetical protein
MLPLSLLSIHSPQLSVSCDNCAWRCVHCHECGHELSLSASTGSFLVCDRCGTTLGGREGNFRFCMMCGSSLSSSSSSASASAAGGGARGGGSVGPGVGSAVVRVRWWVGMVVRFAE